QNREEMEHAVAELENSFLNLLDEARMTSLTSDEQEAVRVIRGKFDAYQANIHTQLQKRGADDGHLPSVGDREQAIDLATAVSTACRTLSDMNERLIDEATSQTKRLQATLMTVRYGFLIFGPLVGLLLGIIVARRLNRSISQISVTLKD